MSSEGFCSFTNSIDMIICNLFASLVSQAVLWWFSFYVSYFEMKMQHYTMCSFCIKSQLLCPLCQNKIYFYLSRLKVWFHFYIFTISPPLPSHWLQPPLQARPVLPCNFVKEKNNIFVCPLLKTLCQTFIQVCEFTVHFFSLLGRIPLYGCIRDC
jgi:hypothetical protein